MVKVNEIIKLNKKFGGSLINRYNLEFDVDMANNESNIYKSNAYLIRGIIVSHAFIDGNKRTALSIITKRFNDNNVRCDDKKLTIGMINIAKDNLNDINKISKRLRRWCSKN